MIYDKLPPKRLPAVVNIGKFVSTSGWVVVFGKAQSIWREHVRVHWVLGTIYLCLGVETRFRTKRETLYMMVDSVANIVVYIFRFNIHISGEIYSHKHDVHE